MSYHGTAEGVDHPASHYPGTLQPSSCCQKPLYTHHSWNIERDVRKLHPVHAWVLDPVPALKVNWFMLANVQLWGAVVELVIIGFQFEPNRWWSSQSQTISSPQLQREMAKAVQDSSAEGIQYHICISLPHFPMFIHWLSSLGHR